MSMMESVADNDNLKIDAVDAALMRLRELDLPAWIDDPELEIVEQLTDVDTVGKKSLERVLGIRQGKTEGKPEVIHPPEVLPFVFVHLDSYRFKTPTMRGQSIFDKCWVMMEVYHGDRQKADKLFYRICSGMREKFNCQMEFLELEQGELEGFGYNQRGVRFAMDIVYAVS